MAAFIEVASQFPDAGGAYTYVRVAFGRFWRLQVGWFWLLSLLGGCAAAVNVFVGYAGNFLPGVDAGWRRVVAISIVLTVPVIANCLGVRQGANLCNFFTAAKVLPLVLIGILGFIKFHGQFGLIHIREIVAPGWNAWLTGLLLLLGAMGGAEDTLAPAGEVRDPRRTLPFGVAMGFLLCVLLYISVQFVTAATSGSFSLDRPLVGAATVLIGNTGTQLISLAVMVSTYGMIAAGVMNAPRLTYALSAHGDFPHALSRLHPRFRTPALAICLFAAPLWVLAISGSFRWLIAVMGGSMAIEYIDMCAALIRLRKTRPDTHALRIPWGKYCVCFGLQFVSFF